MAPSDPRVLRALTDGVRELMGGHFLPGSTAILLDLSDAISRDDQLAIEFLEGQLLLLVQQARYHAQIETRELVNELLRAAIRALLRAAVAVGAA